MTGWKCPCCGACYAPFVHKCQSCGPRVAAPMLRPPQYPPPVYKPETGRQPWTRPENIC